mmetsp:Transcript_17789/g.32955  ORF Transcript_17789/g.32955 Transcript_17789/m.32955 type:complete len:80 (+) Transcript_17789:551-790(+)
MDVIPPDIAVIRVLLPMHFPDAHAIMDLPNARATMNFPNAHPTKRFSDNVYSRYSCLLRIARLGGTVASTVAALALTTN